MFNVKPLENKSKQNDSKLYGSKLYQTIKETKKEISTQENPFPKELLNTVIIESSENMQQIPANSIHLMITSPPYNVAKEYDEDLSLTEYLTMLKSVFEETYRVLVNGGRACINIANVGRKPYVPLSDYISTLMIEIGFNMRGEIIWNKRASVGTSTAWGSWMSASNPSLRDLHEYILIFSKGDYKRDSKGKTNTITKDDFLSWTKSIWEFSTASARKINHPAPFPIELPRRLIQLFSFKDDIILDPFMGSGTTALASIQSGRCFVGFETNKTYANLTKERLSQTWLLAN